MARKVDKSNGLFTCRPSLSSGRPRPSVKALMLGITSMEINPSKLLSPLFCVFILQPVPLHRFSDSVTQVHPSSWLLGHTHTIPACCWACWKWCLWFLVSPSISGTGEVSCHCLHSFVRSESVYFVSGFPLFPLLSQLTGSPVRQPSWSKHSYPLTHLHQLVWLTRFAPRPTPANSSSITSCWPAHQCLLPHAISPHQQDWVEHLGPQALDCCPQSSVVSQSAGSDQWLEGTFGSSSAWSVVNLFW